MIKYKTIIVFFLLLAIGEISSQEDSLHTAVVYGNDNSFAVKAPKGWVLDTKSGLSSGLYAVFFPEGSSWAKAISVMYCNTASKKAKGNETIEEVIKYDIDRFKKEQDAFVNDGENIVTSDSKTAIIKNFYDNRNKNYECVAYIDEKNVVVFLVLSSREKSDYENSLQSFYELVRSYYYLTDNFKIEEKK